MAELLAVGFTASRELGQSRDVVVTVLTTGVPRAGLYITGGAVGGDALIGRWLWVCRPEAQHCVIVPADRSRVEPWWNGCKGAVEVIEMPPGSTYADRNAEIVARSVMLFGFPAYPEDHSRSVRSGSWQTIRMARRAGKLSQWACVMPPYQGQVEKYPSEFGYEGRKQQR